MSGLALAALLAATVLAAVHLLTPKLRFLDVTPRSIWLSLAGGVSVAYVFVHLLPELAQAQEHVGKLAQGAVELFAERHVYLVALLGLAVFYGLDRMALTARSRRAGASVGGGRQEAEEGADAGPAVFWVHMGSFALYNALIGYLLLHREDGAVGPLLFFAFAMALHFIVNDHGLAEHHKSLYRRVGRWILAAAVLLGFAVGLTVEVSEAFVGVLIAFLAGGVILNVLKEEVPSERQSRFCAFALGMGGYAALLLAI
ncbi:MAG TPA: hypothetical protein VGN97_22075 [Mesorhizobium sp.]|jgi:hypothetical protein|nr:hypothetical protein [Mesorhizobium sp.]